MRKKRENQTSGEERFAWKKELKRKRETSEEQVRQMQLALLAFSLTLQTCSCLDLFDNWHMTLKCLLISLWISAADLLP